MTPLIKAISSLGQGCSWYLNGDTYDGLVWSELNTQPKPTEQEVEDEIARLEALEAYQVPRSQEYPSIFEQLDMLWHAIDTNSLNKTSDFYTTLKSIKDKYPKA